MDRQGQSSGSKPARDFDPRNRSRLSEHPHLGRAGRVADTRELVIPRTPYVAVYSIGPDAIDILAVFHGARRWPPEAL
ncbi:type II toxin-antitoxin system RelE/ParE family toxin [Zavarzinia aquatilis]|uniref:type II toxin-antitoxin system RelE/ParE family toxin n=1 Tax=Zavarzinia aquatilis TaxID=2211142 RepID=UPI001A9C9B76|nr:type II toxin-antitoxin system RelE/ParE family toxin [Zavarzinia aquatilis]